MAAFNFNKPKTAGLPTTPNLPGWLTDWVKKQAQNYNNFMGQRTPASGLSNANSAAMYPNNGPSAFSANSQQVHNQQMYAQNMAAGGSVPNPLTPMQTAISQPQRVEGEEWFRRYQVKRQTPQATGAPTGYDPGLRWSQSQVPGTSAFTLQPMGPPAPALNPLPNTPATGGYGGGYGWSDWGGGGGGGYQDTKNWYNQMIQWSINKPE
jgi:hypothetical protein